MVVAIIVILAGLATMYLIPALNQSQSDLARVKARSLETPATTYKLRNGSFPNDLAILAQPDPKYQNNAYVEESAILDPWGNKYMIEFPGESTKVASLTSTPPIPTLAKRSAIGASKVLGHIFQPR